MALATRLGADGVGLSKKDDNPFRASTGRSLRLPWSSLRRRRLILGVIACVLVYLFVKNIPTDVPPVGRRYSPNYGSQGTVHSKLHPELPLEDRTRKVVDPDNLYDGFVRFDNLAASLRNFGPQSRMKNVVFALPKSNSAARMLPFACQMAAANRSVVHVALLGRQPGSIEDVMKANGLTLAGCPVNWHDATPDHSTQSTQARMYASITAGIAYIHSALAPQVFIVDDIDDEDTNLMTVVRNSIQKLGIPLVALPIRAQQTMGWITSLDSSSLKYLNDIQIDIVVQPSSESAGGLIRLLRSLYNADYNGLPPPRLTVELPSKVEPAVLSYLSQISWPPWRTTQAKQLTLRRRIDLSHVSPAVASLRTIESFYPASSGKSHVLLLSPDVELSPTYLHYLLFTLLEYKHAERSKTLASRIAGISLNLPLKRLDDLEDFSTDPLTGHGRFLLSQSPNSNAALYFGDKWMEFHSFMSHRLASDPQLDKVDHPNSVIVSKHYPQWMTQALEFMRLRDYYMVYPSFMKKDQDRLAVVHTELSQPPEEFIESSNLDVEASARFATVFDFSNILNNDVLVAKPGTIQNTIESTLAPSTSSILSLVHDRLENPGEMILPKLGDMPLLSASGKLWNWEKSAQASSELADSFSLGLGACSSLEQRDLKLWGTVEYLFCDADRIP